MIGMIIANRNDDCARFIHFSSFVVMPHSYIVTLVYLASMHFYETVYLFAYRLRFMFFSSRKLYFFFYPFQVVIRIKASPSTPSKLRFFSVPLLLTDLFIVCPFFVSKKYVTLPLCFCSFVKQVDKLVVDSHVSQPG